MLFRSLSFALQPGAAWYCRPCKEPAQETRAIAVGGRLRVNDSDALLRAAIDGLGVALLPDWLSAQAVRDGRLVPLLTDWDWAMTTGPEPAIWGIYPPKKRVSPKVRAFLDFMAERFAGEAAWG